METARFVPGQVIAFEYPAHNYHGPRERLERRRLRVERVRDLADHPLDPLTLALDPLLKRGRVLVTGLDLDRGAERSFYAESMRPHPELPDSPDATNFDRWRVVLVDPDDRPRTRVIYVAESSDEAVAWVDEWRSVDPPVQTCVILPPGAIWP